MKLTLKKNGQEIPVSSGLKDVAKSYKGVENYVIETMAEAAEEALNVMKMAIGGKDDFATLPHGTGFTGTAFERDEYTGADGRPERMQSGRMFNSMAIHPSAKGFKIGALNAPPYFFAQDEGWKKDTMPEGAKWESVVGIDALSHAERAARAIIEEKLADVRLVNGL